MRIIRLLVYTTLLTTGTSLTGQQTSDAKEWLAESIKWYFNFENLSDWDEITTERYGEYKQDAINVVYETSNSLTEEQFEQKWGDIYDISFAGIGESFLLGQQDFGNVVMSKCELTSQPNKGTFIFDTIISDTMFKLTYSVEITIVQTDVGFRIDDVKKTEITDANKR